MICFAAISIDLSLPATICRLLSPYYNIFHVAPLKLLAAVYLAVIVAGVGLSVEILIGFASRCDY